MVSLFIRGLAKALLLAFVFACTLQMPLAVGHGPPASMQRFTDKLTHFFQISRQTAADHTAIAKVTVSVQELRDAVATTEFASKKVLRAHIDHVSDQSMRLELALTDFVTLRKDILLNVNKYLITSHAQLLSASPDADNRWPMVDWKDSLSQRIHDNASYLRNANPVNVTLDCLNGIVGEVRSRLHPRASSIHARLRDMEQTIHTIHKLATLELGTQLRSAKKACSNCPCERLVQQVEHLGVSRGIVGNITASHRQIQRAIEDIVVKAQDFALDLQHSKVDERSRGDRDEFQGPLKQQMKILSKMRQSMHELQSKEWLEMFEYRKE